MLTRKESILLREQLALALSRGDAKNSIRAYLGEEYAIPLLKEMPANLATNDEYAVQVVGYCVRSRWSVTPSLMEMLLVKLLNEGLWEGMDVLTVALDRVRLGIDPNHGCYETLWVLNKQPFLNRRTLRPLLRDFLQSNYKSLFRINGQGAGRTYTKELFDYLKETIESLHVVPIELKATSAPSYKVHFLADEMLMPMGESVPESSSSCNPAQLVRFLLLKIKKQPGTWLFVLDGFEHKDVHPDIKEFIELLAMKCSTPEYRSMMRLVLIDYAAHFEDILPAAFENDDIPLPSVDRLDLIACLEQLNDIREKEKQARLDGPSVIADAILADAPNGAGGDPRANEKARLRYLYDRLCALAKM